jgi:hypothetical protein
MPHTKADLMYMTGVPGEFELLDRAYAYIDLTRLSCSMYACGRHAPPSGP